MNSVITYLFGHADILRDPIIQTPNTKYIVFTDRTDISSKVWEPHLITEHGLDIRACVASAKFNPFIIQSNKYIIIDASHQITSDLTDLFNRITDTTLCVKPHPAKVTIGEEIIRWQTIRHMSQHHVNNIRNLLNLAGADYYNTPIYEGCCLGVSASSMHRYLFQSVLSMLRMLQYDGVWFPSNQIVLSFLIRKLNIPIVTINVSQYANRYHHNTWRLIHEQV